MTIPEIKRATTKQRTVVLATAMKNRAKKVSRHQRMEKAKVLLVVLLTGRKILLATEIMSLDTRVIGISAKEVTLWMTKPKKILNILMCNGKIVANSDITYMGNQ